MARVLAVFALLLGCQGADPDLGQVPGSGGGGHAGSLPVGGEPAGGTSLGAGSAGEPHEAGAPSEGGGSGAGVGGTPPGGTSAGGSAGAAAVGGTGGGEPQAGTATGGGEGGSSTGAAGKPATDVPDGCPPFYCIADCSAPGVKQETSKTGYLDPQTKCWVYSSVCYPDGYERRCVPASCNFDVVECP